MATRSIYDISCSGSDIHVGPQRVEILKVIMEIGKGL